MNARLSGLLSDRLVGTCGWLFTTLMVSNVFTYFFHVAMGRLLTPAEYGFLNSLLSVFIVLGVPLATVPMVLARKTAEYGVLQDHTGIRSLYRLAHRRIFFAGLICLLFFALSSRLIADYLHSPSVTPILLLGLWICSAFTVPINQSLLQGLQDYKWFGISSSLPGPSKLLFCVLLVLAGLGVNGALAGLVLSNLFLGVVAYMPLQRHLKQGDVGARRVHRLSFAHLLPVFTANLGYAILTQADMIFVKRFFSAHEAGMYAAAAILGRSVMYLPGAFVQALLPMVSEQSSLNRDSRHLLFKVLGATLALSGFAAALFFFFPSLILAVFFGPKYIEAAPILRYFGIAMLPMAVLTVLMNYSVARGERIFSYVLAFGAGLEIVLIHRYHRSPLDVLFIMMAVGALLVVPGLMGRQRVEVPVRDLATATR